MSQMSHVLAEDPAVDLAIARAMTDELEEYIIQDDLYRTVFSPTPRGDEKLAMTGGDLLTRLYRLQGERERLTPGQQQELDAVQSQADAVIYSLKSRFNERLLRELGARLDSLRWFLDECSEDSQRCRANYPYEIRNRQRIEEILKRIGDDLPDDAKSRLRDTDRRLEQSSVAHPFIWDTRLEPIFPADQYWYLYRLPRQAAG